MYKFQPRIYKNVVYHTTRTLADAFGLSEKFVRVLVKQVEFLGTETKEIHGELLVPYHVFMELNLPVCRNWFHVLYSYVRESFLLREDLRTRHNFEDYYKGEDYEWLAEEM